MMQCTNLLQDTKLFAIAIQKELYFIKKRASRQAAAARSPKNIFILAYTKSPPNWLRKYWT
jgi:hypothetical protein